ncbi:hypothetical protein, partial [Dysgonomonas reticulitermitis]
IITICGSHADTSQPIKIRVVLVFYTTGLKIEDFYVGLPVQSQNHYKQPYASQRFTYNVQVSFIKPEQGKYR